MTKDEAITGLQSPSPHRRLTAARYFIQNASHEDILRLRQVRQAESDRYVRRRLDEAINRAASPTKASEVYVEPESDSGEELNEQNYAKAVDWVGRALLHEMEGPIGRADNYASREVPNYDQSKTKREIECLKSVFIGISQLVVAAAPPRPEEFDLVRLIEEVISTEVVQASIIPSLHGQKPFLVVSDPAILRLALVNGIKNAAESITQTVGNDVHALTVTWGVTDRDYWVSVIDNGVGVTGSVASKFEIGTSTKPGHSGFGLAVAKRAMESLNGGVTLQPGNNGGARYEIRWERKK